MDSIPDTIHSAAFLLQCETLHRTPLAALELEAVATIQRLEPHTNICAALALMFEFGRKYGITQSFEMIQQKRDDSHAPGDPRLRQQRKLAASQTPRSA